MKNLLLAIGLLFVDAQFATTSVWADAKDEVKKIQGLVQTQNITEAEEAFQAALQEYPDSPELRQLLVPLYNACARAGKHAEATVHALAYLDWKLEQLAEGPAHATGLAAAASMAGSALQMSGKAELGVETIDKAIAAVEARLKESSDPRLVTALDDLRTNKINLLFNSGKAVEAGKLLQSELAAAAKVYDDAPGDAAGAVRLANLMQFEINVAARTAPDSVVPLRTRLNEFVTGELRKHPTSVPLVTTYNTAAIQEIRDVMSSNPDEAEKRLDAWKDFLAKLDTSTPPMKNLVQFANRNVTALELALAAERKRLDLVGKSAIPLDVQDWVNGDPLSDADLKGKVVLLDFWAVWCGPCIATFPHLREWNEKFGPKGLVIVGVTRYYEYEWDDEAKRPKRVKDLPPDSEQAAMVKFAEHHQLKHRFAVIPKSSTFNDAYGVTGIPQAVLIDRTGNVRLIRVGSGDKNAHDLEQMLAELIGESDSAATPAIDK